MPTVILVFLEVLIAGGIVVPQSLYRSVIYLLMVIEIRSKIINFS